MRETHKTRLIKYLKKYGSITPIQAIQDLGNTRLAATIFQLKELGWHIKTEDLKVNTRWGTTTTVAKYTLMFKTNDYDETDMILKKAVDDFIADAPSIEDF